MSLAPPNAVHLLLHFLLSVQPTGCVRPLRTLSQPRDRDAAPSAAVCAGICRRGTSTVCAKQPRRTSTKGPSPMAAPDGSRERPGRLVADRRPPIRYLRAWRSVHGADLATGSLRLEGSPGQHGNLPPLRQEDSAAIRRSCIRTRRGQCRSRPSHGTTRRPFLMLLIGMHLSRSPHMTTKRML